MYQLLMLLHVGGVVIFVGGIVSALFWQRAASRSLSRPIVAHTYQMLNWFDAFVTPIAVATIAITGVILAKMGNVSILRTGWIFWSLIAWGASGILFVTALHPLQKRLEREADENAMWSHSFEAYLRLLGLWARWAHLTLTGIVLAFALMVLKPVLPTP